MLREPPAKVMPGEILRSYYLGAQSVPPCGAWEAHSQHQASRHIAFHNQRLNKANSWPVFVIKRPGARFRLELLCLLPQMLPDASHLEHVCSSQEELVKLRLRLTFPKPPCL